MRGIDIETSMDFEIPLPYAINGENDKINKIKMIRKNLFKDPVAFMLIECASYHYKKIKAK